MRSPRITLAWLMIAVAIEAFHRSILGAVLRGHILLSQVCGLDMGLVPIGTALGLALGDQALRRQGPRPFSLGFAAFGSAAILVYICCCLLMPETMAMPDLYYINEIEPRFMDASYAGLFFVRLQIRGLLLALPQLSVALIGGLLARRFASGPSFATTRRG